MAAYIASLFDAALTWKDIQWLAELTKLPVLVKGILRTDDALRGVNHGVSAINRVQPRRKAAGYDAADHFGFTRDRRRRGWRGRSLVYLDGGIRRGTDVLKALAYR